MPTSSPTSPDTTKAGAAAAEPTPTADPIFQLDDLKKDALPKLPLAHLLALRATCRRYAYDPDMDKAIKTALTRKACWKAAVPFVIINGPAFDEDTPKTEDIEEGVLALNKAGELFVIRYHWDLSAIEQFIRSQQEDALTLTMFKYFNARWEVGFFVFLEKGLSDHGLFDSEQGERISAESIRLWENIIGRAFDQSAPKEKLYVYKIAYQKLLKRGSSDGLQTALSPKDSTTTK